MDSRLSNEEATPLLEAEEDVPTPSCTSTHLITIILSVVAFLLGVTQTLPLAILIPESLGIGLSPTQSSLIISAWPAASLLSLILQTHVNKTNRSVSLIVLGIVGCICYSSFRISITLPAYYLYLAVLARFIGGTSHFLIANMAGVAITRHLQGDVNRATSIWEIFNSAGQGCGAYIGAVLNSSIGFGWTLVSSGIMVLVTVVVLSCYYYYRGTPRQEARDSVTSSHSARDLCKLHVTGEMLVYCWLPYVCVGGCMAFGEGMITQFYKQDYSKTLEFGGILLGGGGVAYVVAAVSMGLLRARWPVLVSTGLIGGLLGLAGVLPLLGPIFQLADPSDSLIVSIVGFNLLLVCSAAVQLNGLTLCAESVSNRVSSDIAMSISLNSVNVAYNVGAFIGPVIGSSLLSFGFTFAEAFTIGSPFFLVSGLIVMICIMRRNWGNISDTRQFTIN